MFGSHLSIAGSMSNALIEADPLGLDTVQVFTKNQQQWQVKPLDAAVVSEWVAGLTSRGWLDRTVSHASYLINLASVQDELWNKSVDLMTVEFERCETLRIPYLVHHPGSFVGSTLEEGIARIAKAYKVLLKRTKGFRTIACLEGTAGAGSHIGGPLEHLKSLQEQIIEATGESARVGFCLDTCHLHAAGHDMSTRESADAVLERFDALCGITNVRVMHLNDSKGKLASKLDRHEHIGEGWVGGGASMHTGKGAFSSASLKSSGFAAVVNHPHLRGVPKILETPKGLTEKGVSFDTMNLDRLKSLIDQPPAASKPSKAATKAKSAGTRR
ncbi:MAG: deoxyribonuclease IV [Planctomycetota bacterium]|nr:deoxyribonuclease IV [Planctomycetota bacterium]